MSPILKYGIVLRLVEESDAEFILSLRTNPFLNKYISATSDNLTDQITWIRNYKTMESAGLEFYFIAEDFFGKKYGTIRLYNFDSNEFEIGSWVFLPNSPLGMAIKAHIIAIETGFDFYNAVSCRFEVRKMNLSVVNYIKDFKSTLVREDDLHHYYYLTRENFFSRKNKISFLLKG